MSGGEFAAPGNWVQLQEGIDNDSPELFYEDLMKGGKNLGNPELVRILADNALSNAEWLRDTVGVQSVSYTHLARLEMFEVAGQVIKKVSCATEKTSYPVTAYGNCGETDETGLTAPFYYMEVPGPVSLQQASGKIVLVNGYLNYKLYQSLIDSGAVGFITYNGEARDSEETTDIAHRELREKPVSYTHLDVYKRQG